MSLNHLIQGSDVQTIMFFIVVNFIVILRVVNLMLKIGIIYNVYNIHYQV